jgi:hypothetical protein
MPLSFKGNVTVLVAINMPLERISGKVKWLSVVEINR